MELAAQFESEKSPKEALAIGVVWIGHKLAPDSEAAANNRITA